MTASPRFLNREDDRDGRVSILELDSEIFGFPVAEWELPAEGGNVETARPYFEQWAIESEARLISCRVPATDFALLATMQRLDFKVVDCLVALGLNRVQRTPLDSAPLPLREAEARDWSALEEIAGRAFQTGRYHLDPLFPRHLADRRYAQWVRNALTGRVPGSVALVAEHEGTIAGFLIDRIAGDQCDGQLACVNPRFKNSIVMHSLLAAHTAWLQDRGVRRTTGRISIGLMQAINLNLVLHAELRSADYILHWHSPAHPLR